MEVRNNGTMEEYFIIEEWQDEMAILVFRKPVFGPQTLSSPSTLETNKDTGGTKAQFSL